MTVMVQVVLGPWLNKKCDKTISTAWNDNIALGYETEARDRESKETLDRLHEQTAEQKPRGQGGKEEARRPASGDGTCHAWSIRQVSEARDTVGSPSSAETQPYL